MGSMSANAGRQTPSGYVETIGEHHVVLVNSVTHLDDAHAGCVVVSGSHGGVSSAEFLRRAQPLVAIVSDAGVGKDQAGIAGLAVLDEHGIAAATSDYRSAMIGEAEDTWENGVISHVNEAAATLGLQPGAGVRDTLRSALGPAAA
jgi:hypothetical protein